ncbi:MAG: M48 family metallopeptidase [Alphaproteobacteria bacterium]|nr:M48 family metallopeptidase [Alphaproteobacteria bacterium]MDP6563472.1 M48 family metallopeptidase [Alphaproteobacteria bacterium]MDP6815657.1 M48 family metallopeptidase [Alphaproteobacteria bacterium]
MQLAADGLHIAAQDPDIRQRWAYADLRAVAPPRSDAPLRLTSLTAPDARLQLTDPAEIDALRRRAPHLFQRGLARPKVRRDAAIVILALIALGLLLWQGVPRLSAPLARLIPLQWERNLGLSFRDRLLAGAELCRTTAGSAALSRLIERLIMGLPAAAALTVVVADSETVNAFALPGGQVVILRGLLATAESADEVAAVLAHEIGHVSHRHPTQMAIRAFGIGLVGDLLTGEGSALVELAGEVGGALLLLSYSRDMERQADAFARDLLHRQGLSTNAMARFFARLHDRAPTGEYDKTLAYLNSHPPLAERIAASAEADAGVAALDADAWRALRRICD